MRLFYGMTGMFGLFGGLKDFQQSLVLPGEIEAGYFCPGFVFALADKGDIAERAGGSGYFLGRGAAHELKPPIDQRTAEAGLYIKRALRIPHPFEAMLYDA